MGDDVIPAQALLMRASELEAVAHTMEATIEAVQWVGAVGVEGAAVFKMEYPLLFHLPAL